MNEAVLKTIVLVLLIAIGLILKGKFGSKERIDGIKELVLSVALPSTIFIALMKINLDASLIFVPFVTLLFNFFMYWATPLALGAFGVPKHSDTGRTLILLVPSLAPGLSSFPFIVEFLGEESLALAAMSDIGNKFFVLIFLYLIAMNMFLKNNNASEESNTAQKIKSLLVNLAKEPINILLVVALVLLAFGFQYEKLPAVVKGVFDKTSALMTPLVLIFIGLAVKFKEGNKRVVFSLLLFRAGLSLLFVVGFLSISGIHSPSYMLLAVAIALSSISFWPFAHICLFNGREEAQAKSKTFNVELAIMVLAMSLPFSTILVLSILSAGTYFADIWKLGILGLGMTALGLIPITATRFYVKQSQKMA